MSDEKNEHKKPGPNFKLQSDKVIEALTATGGIVTAAASMLGVSRSTVNRFIKANPDVQAAKDVINETILDLAEGEMLKSLKAGDGQMVRWFLDRRGGSRGYSPRQEITGKGGKPIEVTAAPTVDWSELTPEVAQAMLEARVDVDEPERN